MFTCILVDDEKWVGVDLQKSVHWLDYGFDAPRFFQDPLQALEVISAEPPDVLFTDIRMAGMSGIDLIAEIRKRGIECEVVILSAYEDFGAAQWALRLHVLDYCLKPINVPQLESLLETLAEKLGAKQQAGKTAPAQDTDYSAPIQQVIAYLEANLGHKITLVDAAEAVFLNKNYLCTLFHAETGKTFSEYLTQVRITKAKELLQSTSLPISEIANQLAYCDHFYFSKVFKKKVGLSPYAFRSDRSPQSEC